MDRKSFISFVVMIVLAFALNSFIHGILLFDDYAKLPNLMRPPAEANAHVVAMAVAYVCIGAGFTWAYVQGREDRPWFGQGMRYGFAIILLTAVPTYLIYHVVSYFPLDLAIKQIVLQSIVIEIMAVALAWIYRNA